MNRIFNKIQLYVYTLRYMRPKQIGYQLLNRIKPVKPDEMVWRLNYTKLPVHQPNLLLPELDLNIDYLNRFCTKQMLDGKITLLYTTEKFDGSKWKYSNCSPLWNFNLQYFEYAIALATVYKEQPDSNYGKLIETLYSAWMENGGINAWHSYTISLRIRNLLITREIMSENISAGFEELLYRSIYQQYKYLDRHKEKKLLGNHYFENLCTLVICSDLYGEDAYFKRYIKMLLKEIKEEILPDGIHFERSLMYHKLLLEDLLRILKVLNNRKEREIPTEDYIRKVIQKMLTAIVSLEKGVCRTPLFNDAGDNIAKNVKQLEKTCRFFGINSEERTYFPEAGYYKQYGNDIAVLVDAGPIGPDYIPGHGQCDALSFELYYQTKPLFVNCGTGLYQGKLRNYFRSTSAHNTVLINGHEQSECWAEHRIARRISNVKSVINGDEISCQFDNYRHEIHKRKIRLIGNIFSVKDSTEKTEENKMIESYLHIAPEFQVEKNHNAFKITKCGIEICRIIPENASSSLQKSCYAPEFGKIEEIVKIVFCWQADEQQHGYQVIF